VDIGYTGNFYREAAPNHIAFAALSVGRSPGCAMRPKRILELGCGQGFGLSLLAAANPDVSFEGLDTNSEHVAHARQLISTAKLHNITVTESSFEAAAELGSADDLDVIALHGTFSLVTRSAQDAIVSVIRQRLQPDGMLYLSYHCMPGWAPLAPIPQLMLEVKRRNAGCSESQLAHALHVVNKLKQGGAAYFAFNPAAAHHVDQMLTMDRDHLAHDYFHEELEVFRFADVAQRMGAVNLAYVASATLTENLDQYALPAGLLLLVRETKDSIMRETLRDYAANKRLRRDLFTRGAATLKESDHRRRLSELAFALAVPRKRVAYSFIGPLTPLNVRPEFYDPVYDLLADKPASFDELAALPIYGEGRIALLIDCLCLLVGSGQVYPLVAAQGIDCEPSRRFNRMIVNFARTRRSYGALAAPILRSGIAIRDIGLLALAAVMDGKAEDAEMAAKHALSILKSLGQRPMQDGRLINDDSAALDFLASTYRPILEEDLPIWRQLGML
jgi:SAM-dependent methyltransferase